LDDTFDSTHDDRIAALRALAESDPADATAWFLLGRELLATGRAAEAVPAFASAIVADADYTAAYRQLGSAFEGVGRVKDAVETYRKGLEVAERTHDLQTGKEMTAMLKRIARGRGAELSG
jgi:tetratricopeptide (TPR) repeat protein